MCVKIYPPQYACMHVHTECFEDHKKLRRDFGTLLTLLNDMNKEMRRLNFKLHMSGKHIAIGEYTDSIPKKCMHVLYMKGKKIRHLYM